MARTLGVLKRLPKHRIPWKRFVRELRRRGMLTQRELGGKLNVDKLTISRWERGIREPLVRHRRALLVLSDEVK
jgi:transcriptional regulator with XRE-family HTH domain